MGGAQDFQLRLGWGPMETVASAPARAIANGGAGLYLRNAGSRLRVAGWAGAPGTMTVRVDGTVVGQQPLSGDRFDLALDLPQSPRELRDISLEPACPQPGGRVLVREVAIR
jgi:hypothetical protein